MIKLAAAASFLTAFNLLFTNHCTGYRGDTVVKALCYKSPVRFQMVSMEFFIDIIFPIALWPWGRLSL